MWQHVTTFLFLVIFSRVRASDDNCNYPYVAVGDRCLFFGTMAQLQHNEARQMCHSMNGELAAVLTATHFKELVDYIYDHGLSGNGFWIDGSDSEVEGHWQTSDGVLLPMGTPFWATTYLNQEPNNEGDEDCVDIQPFRNYYMNDVKCEDLKSPVCEQKMAAVARVDREPRSCPMPYVELAGLCLAFITWADQSWTQARQTCHGMHGELAAITDIEQLRAVYLYLHQESITHDSFWLGGTDLSHEGRWTWTDGSLVNMGTPFWGYYLNIVDGQEPQGGTGENCLYLDHNGGHYFYDGSCDWLLNPLCMLN